MLHVIHTGLQENFIKHPTMGWCFYYGTETMWNFLQKSGYYYLCKNFQGQKHKLLYSDIKSFLKYPPIGTVLSNTLTYLGGDKWESTLPESELTTSYSYYEITHIPLQPGDWTKWGSYVICENSNGTLKTQDTSGNEYNVNPLLLEMGTFPSTITPGYECESGTLNENHIWVDKNGKEVPASEVRPYSKPKPKQNLFRKGDYYILKVSGSVVRCSTDGVAPGEYYSPYSPKQGDLVFDGKDGMFYVLPDGFSGDLPKGIIPQMRLEKYPY